MVNSLDDSRLVGDARVLVGDAIVLLGTIFDNGAQCLNQAVFHTGITNYDRLKSARDYLLEKGVIRPVDNHDNRSEEFVCYEISV